MAVALGLWLLSSVALRPIQCRGGGSLTMVASTMAYYMSGSSETASKTRTGRKKAGRQDNPTPAIH
jgi:hypothetical protein